MVLAVTRYAKVRPANNSSLLSHKTNSLYTGAPLAPHRKKEEDFLTTAACGKLQQVAIRPIDPFFQIGSGGLLSQTVETAV